MPVVSDYTALLSGDYWNGIEVTGKPVIVTYSFPTSAAGYMADIDGFTPATVGSFQAFSSTEQDQARAALGEWAAASGLIFVQVAPGRGDINFQLVDLDTTSDPSYAGAGGIGFYPFGDWNFFTYPSFASDLDGSGDVFMNSQFEAGDSVAYGTLLHEIGHAIGLKHPTEIVTNFAANPLVTHDQVLSSDDPALTIMAEVGGPGIPDHLKTLDEQAAAFIYGPAGTGRVVTGNASGSNAAVSSWSWKASTQTLIQVGFAGDDTIRGSSVRDVVSGLDGDDKLFGLDGNDTLEGGAGNDLLNGGPGTDTLKGGANDDTYMVDSMSDKVIELADDGDDRVLASISYTLSANVELLQIFGAGLTGQGNDLSNSIFGDGSLGSKLYGLGGDDYLLGGSGKDRLDGGTGADAMFGGGNNDTYLVDNEADVAREDSDPGIDDGGIDVVNASASFTLGAFVENLALTGTAAIDGTGNALDNSIKGNNAVNHLTGGVGADVLTGNGGADIMDGGENGDTYVADATDIIHDTGASGIDRVQSTGSFTLAAGSGIEQLSTRAGVVGGDLTGDEGANTITGNTGANVLSGKAGKDTLLGGGGADTLIGGADRDTMTGGGGADIFGFALDDSLAISGGFDTVADFETGIDRIDLGIFGGAPASSAYAEIALASNSFAALKSAAEAQLTGDVKAVFVAGSTNGWLFWNTDANAGTAEEAVALAGRTSLNDFAVSDLM